MFYCLLKNEVFRKQNYFLGAIAMGEGIEPYENLSVIEIEKIVEIQANQVNKVTAWLIGGLLVIVYAIESPIQIIACGAILYGLLSIIDGKSIKSSYQNMIPENLHPQEIKCLQCRKLLELNVRFSLKYFCPIFDQNFHYIST